MKNTKSINNNFTMQKSKQKNPTLSSPHLKFITFLKYIN